MTIHPKHLRRTSEMQIKDGELAYALSPRFLRGCNVTGNHGLQTATISTGSARSDDDVDDIDVVSTLTLTMTSTGANGRDAGSATNGVWYVFIIKKSSDGTIAALASTSPTTPTMPSGYDLKRLVGTLTYISSAVVGTFQRGQGSLRETVYNSSVQQGSAGVFTRSGAGTTTYNDAISWANYIPIKAHRACLAPQHSSQANASYTVTVYHSGSSWAAQLHLDTYAWPSAGLSTSEVVYTSESTRSTTVAVTAYNVGTYTANVYQNLYSFAMEY